MGAVRIFRRSRGRGRGNGGFQQPFFQSSRGEGEYAAGGQAFFASAPAGVQPKLSIGQPGDKYEREADAVADRVVSVSSADVVGATPAPAIQTMCAECAEEQGVHHNAEQAETGLQRKMDKQEEKPKLQRKMEKEEEKPKLQRKMDKEEEKPSLSSNILMRKTTDGQNVETAGLSTHLGNSKGGGRPLPVETEAYMSSAFGRDFGHVRIHTDHAAIQMNEGLNAKAFTHGADIYFNRGQYAPESTAGRRLLAHELTHTVQQGTGNRNTANPATASKDGAPSSGGAPRKEGCCSQAASSGQDNGDIAGVICCNKKKYACVWISGGAQGATNAKAKKIVDHCGGVHERAHFDDIDCPDGKGPTRPNFKAGKDAAAEEKKSYKAEAACLESRIGSCGKDETCKAQVKKELDYVKTNT